MSERTLIRMALVFVLVIVVLLLTGQISCHAEKTSSEDAKLPDDPVIRCATKALRGDYGELAEWQRVGYQQILDNGSTWAVAWVTQYYPQEGFKFGDVCRWWGEGCSLRVAAANELPGFSFIWSNQFGLKQILDTGADSNDGVARRKGADHWIDLWVPYPGHHGFVTEIMEVAAVRGRQPAKWKHKSGAPENAWLRY